MIPTKPISIKLTDEQRARVSRAARALGYPEGRFVIASVEAVLDLVFQPQRNAVPKIVCLGRQALSYEQAPAQFQSPEGLDSRPATLPASAT